MRKAIYLSAFIFLLTISVSVLVKADNLQAKPTIENVGDDPEKAKTEATTEKKDDCSEAKKKKLRQGSKIFML